VSEKSYSILCVDDEENILNALKRLLRHEEYRMFATADIDEAFAILQKNPVQLVISDQRMPQMSGTEFLSAVKTRYPEVIRIILTGYTDVDSITEAVNKGLIYKFLLKPWNDEDLKLDIRQALGQYELVRSNTRLQEKILEQNEQLRVINENLEEMVRERTEELEIKNHALELARAVLEDVPIAVVGVGAEGIVAFINRETSRLAGSASSIAVGRDLADSVPPELAAEIMKNINIRETVHLEACRFGEALYDIGISALTGRFHGRGLVLTFSETKSPFDRPAV
jgi:response regulator RpfG family c-di-GMP phosphodiesterase